jgi:hypothetical protein
VPLALLQAALAAQGVEKDADEVECVLANLIFSRYVKGYIAHRARVAVLSKADPFPPLSDVSLADPF